MLKKISGLRLFIRFGLIWPLPQKKAMELFAKRRSSSQSLRGIVPRG